MRTRPPMQLLAPMAAERARPLAPTTASSDGRRPRALVVDGAQAGDVAAGGPRARGAGAADRRRE
jgi:hypothetical protein